MGITGASRLHKEHAPHCHWLVESLVFLVQSIRAEVIVPFFVQLGIFLHTTSALIGLVVSPIAWMALIIPDEWFCHVVMYLYNRLGSEGKT